MCKRQLDFNHSQVDFAEEFGWLNDFLQKAGAEQNFI